MMNIFHVRDLDTDLRDNKTQIIIEKVAVTDEIAYFDVSNANIFDTEGVNEETSLMFEIRDYVDCTIPEILAQAEKFNKSLKIESVIDYTPDNGPDYYYKVDESQLDETLKEMFNTGTHDLYDFVHEDRITDFFINDELELILKD